MTVDSKLDFFVKSSEGGGGIISDPKNYIADFVLFKAAKYYLADFVRKGGGGTYFYYLQGNIFI